MNQDSLGIISVSNAWLQLDGFPNNILTSLYKECRYRPDGFIFVSAYKCGKWDGWVNLLSKSTNKARSGLFNRVVSHLQTKFPTYKYLVKDTRTIRFDGQADLLPACSLNFDPRDYQLSIASLVLGQSRATIELPTGSGKTKLASFIISSVRQPAIFVVPNLLLLHQTYESFSHDIDFGGEYVGVVGDGNCFVPPECRLVICTAQTLSRLLSIKIGKLDITDDNFDCNISDNTIYKYSDFIDYFATVRLAIWDEVHHTAAELYYKATAKFDNVTRLYGLSATPYRRDGATLRIEAVSGPTYSLNNIGSSFSILLDGVLCKPDIYSILVPEHKSVSITGTYQDNYNKQIIKNTDRHKIIATLAKKHKKVIVAVNRIKQGNEIAKELGSSAIECYSNTDGLYSKFTKWKSGKVKILISTLVGEGFDVPDVDCLIVASPSSDIMQEIGRVIRRSPNKDKAYVYVIEDDVQFLKRINKKKNVSWQEKFPDECNKGILTMEEV